MVFGFKLIKNSKRHKVTKEDVEFIKNKINSAPIKQDEKEIILDILTNKKGTAESRNSALERLNYIYKGIFMAKYDGKIYMIPNTPGNILFNKFLEDRKLTLDKLDDINLIDTEFTQFTNNYYSLAVDKQGKNYC